MPLYEYECQKHGMFELIRKFSDPPLAACPTCGGPIEKLLSAPAIQFKGTGWYITDYARKSTGGEAAGKDSSDKGGAGDSAKDKGGKKEPSKETSSSSSSESKSSTSDTKSSSPSGTSDKK